MAPKGQDAAESFKSPLKAKADALWRTRRELPVWRHSEKIRKSLRGDDSDVLVLSGETGSGKSTQVPQILLSETWCRKGGCIAITQPRRIAAITLARRVAAEVGTPLGTSSKSSQVGYSVRFDHNAGPNTRIKFLTEGTLLQEMLRDPWLKAYNAVIVDEVHERGVNVDLLLGFLKTLVRRSRLPHSGRSGIPLKVVVMSATAETEKIKSFFEADSTAHSEPKTKRLGKEVIDNSSNPEDEWNGFSSAEEEEEEEEAAVTGQNHNRNDNRTTSHARVSVCAIEGRQHPVKTIYTPEPVQDWVNAALHTIFQIHYKEALPGDILVFMTGQETVESLESLANEYVRSMSSTLPKMLVLPLFAALPQDAQNKVFEVTPPGTRKVVLSTNIAETSVTVPGVRYVIDCGKAKVKQFRSKIGLESLLVKPISQSAAIQRQGRAGREAPGHCYRLYAEMDYHAMQQANTPEILRCDLSQAILTILTLKDQSVQDVISFPFLDPPPREALEKALVQLFQLGALTETGQINEIGRQMSQLPLPCPLARTLLSATETRCVADVIDIVSCLSVEKVFIAPKSEDKKEAAEAARRTLYRREGDHLTLLATVQACVSEQSDRKAWADRHFISHRAMRAVMVCNIDDLNAASYSFQLHEPRALNN